MWARLSSLGVRANGLGGFGCGWRVGCSRAGCGPGCSDPDPGSWRGPVRVVALLVLVAVLVAAVSQDGEPQNWIITSVGDRLTVTPYGRFHRGCEDHTGRRCDLLSDQPR